MKSGKKNVCYILTPQPHRLMLKVYVNDHLDAFDLDEALAKMSPQRHDYLLRFRHERSQRAGAAAYMLLCQGLRELYGITEPPVFAFGEHGKPFLAERPEIYFSLSHCREAAACAVSDSPVGIDVESLRSFSPSLLSRTMSAEESAVINTDDDPRRAFIRLWTQKEAYLKLTGTGLVDELPMVLTDAAARGYIFDVRESDDAKYILSVCHLDPEKHND